MLITVHLEDFRMKLWKDVIKEFVSRTAVISVIITYFFFFLAQSIKADMIAISFSQYLLLFVFSLILSASFFIFRIPIAKPLCLLIHYAVTCVSFFVIFAATKKLSFPTTASLFVAIALYTLIYAAIFGILLLVKYLMNRFASRTVKSHSEKPKEKPSYEKRF